MHGGSCCLCTRSALGGHFDKVCADFLHRFAHNAPLVIHVLAPGPDCKHQSLCPGGDHPSHLSPLFRFIIDSVMLKIFQANALSWFLQISSWFLMVFVCFCMSVQLHVQLAIGKLSLASLFKALQLLAELPSTQEAVSTVMRALQVTLGITSKLGGGSPLIRPRIQGLLIADDASWHYGL